MKSLNNLDEKPYIIGSYVQSDHQELNSWRQGSIAFENLDWQSMKMPVNKLN
jgi:hypothetical protein